MFRKNLYLISFIIFIIFSKQAISLPTYINPDTWLEKPPSESKMNVYDELLLDVIPRFWYNLSPHGKNLGTKIEAEVLIWEGKDFCAYLTYDRIFDPNWAYDYSYLLGKKLKNLWKQTKNSQTYPFFNERCAMFDTSLDFSGKRKRLENNNIGRIDKKKGIKGNLKPVRVQTFRYLDPDMECLFFAGGLGTSGWVGYDAALTLASIAGHICVPERKYFDQKKIKQIARSLGVEDILDESLKIKAPPPNDLRLDLSKFDTVTGKRENYYINVSTKNEVINETETKKVNENESNNDSLEDQLRQLKKLFEEELITKDEYDLKRLEILDQF